MSSQRANARNLRNDVDRRFPLARVLRRTWAPCGVQRVPLRELSGQRRAKGLGRPEVFGTGSGTGHSTKKVGARPMEKTRRSGSGKTSPLGASGYELVYNDLLSVNQRGSSRQGWAMRFPMHMARQTPPPPTLCEEERRAFLTSSMAQIPPS